MDAVSRLIYWGGDPGRGENEASLNFLKRMNQGLHQLHPDAMLIAEDSTDFDGVTRPVEFGGLGFDYKWDMGWMNDFLDYIESQSCSPSLSQAQKLKAASKEGALDHGKLLEIMGTKKPSVLPRDPTLTISVSKIARYFPAGYTQEQMVGIIMQLLERNSRHLMPEKQTSLER